MLCTLIITLKSTVAGIDISVPTQFIAWHHVIRDDIISDPFPVGNCLTIRYYATALGKDLIQSIWCWTSNLNWWFDKNGDLYMSHLIIWNTCSCCWIHTFSQFLKAITIDYSGLTRILPSHTFENNVDNYQKYRFPHVFLQI